MKETSKIIQVLNDKHGNYMLPFFWQHGESEDVLRDYMRAIHEANIGAVCVESRPHPDFVGEQWWHDMDIILDEAKKRNMKVWILDDEHFPTGYAAGKVKTAPKELRHQYLYYNRIEVCGSQPQIEFYVEDLIHPSKKQRAKSQFELMHDDQLFKIIACESIKGGHDSEPIDVTDCVVDGTFKWDVPKGYWMIYVIYLTRDANGRNDYINFLDQDSCRLLIDAVYESHYDHYKELFGSVIAGFFSDEPPVGNIPTNGHDEWIGNPNQILPWSWAVPDQLTKEFGSDEWCKYLPFLWNVTVDKQREAQIRVAYMNAVTKLIETCFSNQLGEWCAEHGVEYIGHSIENLDHNTMLGCSLGHYFRGLGGQHMAGIDNIGGSVIIGGQDAIKDEKFCQDRTGCTHYVLGKLGTSHAAIDPKKKGRSMCENLGAYGWQTGVRDMKYYMDFFMVRGINHFVPHAFSPKAFPDQDCPPHFYAHGENQQYKAFGDLMAYCNRVCHLINDGHAYPTVALVYHGESDWAGDFQSNTLAARVLSQNQIDFHIIPSDVFSEPEKFKTQFDGNVLKINETEYKSLVISGCDFLSEAVAQFAVEANQKGFPVIITNPMPYGICEHHKKDEKFLKQLNKINTADVDRLADTIKQIVEMDVQLEHEFSNLTVYHYDYGEELYMFLNEDANTNYTGTVTLAAKGTPVCYDAWENCIYPVDYERVNGQTKVSLDLMPLEMKIILLEEDRAYNKKERCNPQKNTIKLSEFTIYKAEALQYPVFTSPRQIKRLESMSEYDPDFSGWYRYETTIELEEIENALLKITDVYECAEVFVNGKSAGNRIAQPYVYDISPLVQKGLNTITMDVATNMARKVRAMGEEIYSMHIIQPMPKSGIVGDVTIHWD